MEELDEEIPNLFRTSVRTFGVFDSTFYVSILINLSFYRLVEMSVAGNTAAAAAAAVVVVVVVAAAVVVAVVAVVVAVAAAA